MGFPELEGNVLLETSHVALSVSRALTFCVMTEYGCLCYHLLLEEASLMMVEQDTGLSI